MRESEEALATDSWRHQRETQHCWVGTWHKLGDRGVVSEGWQVSQGQQRCVVEGNGFCRSVREQSSRWMQ